MKQYLRIVVLVLCSGCVIAEDPQVKFYNFDTYSGTENQLTDFVNTIIQDKKGFLWFATDNGLTRFDGHTFKKFSYDFSNEAIADSNVIYDILEIDPGIILLCTKDGIIRFNVSENQFTMIKDDINGADRPGYWKMVRISSQYILFISSSNRIRIMDLEKNEIKDCVLSNNKDSINGLIITLFKDSSGRIWLGADERKGLYTVHVDFNTMTLELQKAEFLKHSIVFDVVEDSQKNLVFSSLDGIFLYSHSTQTLSKIGDVFGVFKLFFDKDDTLWIPSYKSGLLFYDNTEKKLKEFKQYYDLKTDNIWTIYQDREGTFWGCSGKAGVFKFNKVQSRIIEFLPEIKEDVEFSHISNVVEHNDELWVASAINGVYRVNRLSGEFDYYSTPDKIVTFYISGLAINEKGDVFVSTQGDGLFLYNRDTDSFDNVYQMTDNDFQTQYINTMEFISPYKILIGSKGLCVYDHKQKTSRKICGNQLYDEIKGIVKRPGKNNVFYVGTENSGLYVLDIENEKCEQVLVDNKVGLKKEYRLITDVQNEMDNSDSLYFSALRSGIFKYDTDTHQVDRIVSTDSINNGSVYRFVQDNFRNIWIVSDQGVFIYSKVTGEIRQNFEVNKFIEYELLNQLSKIGDTLLVERDGDLLSIYPPDLNINRKEPEFSLTDCQLLNGSGYFTNKPVIDHTLEIEYNDVIKLSFSSFSYVSPKFNTYAYRLTPANNSWIDLGNTNTLFFSNLEQGTYTLELKGSNNDGIFNSSPYVLTIKVNPPFYKTWWFRTLIFAILLIILIQFFKYRIRLAEKRIQEKSDLQLFYKINDISAREQEIIEQMVKGKNREEIGEILFISPHTVKNHIYNIYKKLEVRNRGELLLKIKEKFNESGIKDH